MTPGGTFLCQVVCQTAD